MKQSYEQAVLKTVTWWGEKIQSPLNQNNGDNSPNGGMAFLLMNMAAGNAQESITPHKVDIFKTALTDRLMGVENEKYLQTLDVDYHPNAFLSESAQIADIDASAFPCKTWTRIGRDNEVEVSMGYGTVPSVI